MSTEVEERFNSTPLKSLVMLSEIIEDGTVTINFNHRAALLSNLLTSNIDGSVRLSSNTEARNYALEAQLNAYGETFDIDAYMNRERIALRLQLLGDDFYGFRYDTFRDDIRDFGGLIGLDNQTMNMLADIVDQINEMMNAEDVSDETFEAYSEVFENFAKNLEVTSNRIHIDSGEDRVRCTAIEFNITREAIVTLLNDLYVVLENDESMRAQLEMSNNPLLSDIMGGFGGYEYFLREFRNYVRDFERNYSGDITLVFFIGRNDRLLRMVVNADTVYDGESAEANVTFSFGDSINDEWEFSFLVTSGDNTDTMTIQWSFEEQSGKQVNTIRITTVYMKSFTLMSEWDEDSGNFTLAYEDNRERNEITGVFTTDDKNFRIEFDNLYPANSGATLLIEVLAETGANIGEVEYINIDKWGNVLLEAIMRLIMSGVLF